MSLAKRQYYRRLIVFGLLGLVNLTFADDSPIEIPDVTLKSTTSQNGVKPSQNVQTSGFNRNQIATTANAELDGLLREQSIVRLVNISSNMSQVALSIRGFGDNASANSLILVDGFPLTNSTLLAPNFNSFILSDIENIEIIQGSQGTLYGNQAVGGVLKINTRHPEKFFANFDVGLGGYDREYLSAILGNKFNNGIFYKVSGYVNQTTGFREHNTQENDGATSQLGIDYAQGSLTFNQYFAYNSTEYPGGLSYAQYQQNWQQATDFSDYSQYITQIYQILSKHQLNDQWLLETRLEHNQVDGQGRVFYDFHNTQWIDSFNPQLTGFLGKYKWIFGYTGQLNGYKDVNTAVESHVHDNENDLYAQTTIPLLAKLDLTLGGRSAWQNNAPQTSSPAFSERYTNHVLVSEQGLAYRLNPQLNFYLRRDGNFRFPKANEQVWLADNVTTLLPQTGVSYETGTDWHTLRQHTQLNLYILQLHNELAFDPTQTPTQPFGAISNLDETLRKGVTFTEDYHLTPALDAQGQINYVHARFNSGTYDGNFIPAVPAWTNSATLSYRFLPNWRASYTALYNGSAYASNDVANAGNKVPDYWLSKIALQRFFKHSKLNFEVTNIFNQRYSLYTTYNSNTGANTYYSGVGRNYLLTFKTNID